MSPFGLLEADLETLIAILRSFPQVERAVIYGSRALGTHRPGSDGDLALFGGTDLNHGVLRLLTEALEESSLPYLFDLTVFETLNHPGLREHILRVGKDLYHRDPAAAPRKESGNA